jgi:hypothetical protein
MRAESAEWHPLDRSESALPPGHTASRKVMLFLVGLVQDFERHAAGQRRQYWTIAGTIR